MMIRKGLKMTVSELITLLSTLPADARVFHEDADYGYTAPSVVLDSDGVVVIGVGESR